jgi:hypothetical protein
VNFSNQNAPVYNDTVVRQFAFMTVVWGVVGMLVVIASFITMYIAYTRVDPVVDENYYQKGLALSPSVQSRDHPEAAHAPASLSTPPVKP